VDAALLDVNLAGENTAPVAEELRRRGIPFAFATGYGRELELPPEMRSAVPVIPKPYQRQDIAELVGRSLGGGG
jgi:CheY-like chemotaxis protein